MTVKEVKAMLKAMRKINEPKEMGENIITIGEMKIQRLYRGCNYGDYAICIGEDDSDPYTDYSAWSYGIRAKRIVEILLEEKTITA